MKRLFWGLVIVAIAVWAVAVWRVLQVDALYKDRWRIESCGSC